ncbi:MAG: MBL fold metallo-hydrolase [Armatimonadota bacterium]|nr:MBL fold metallo-hydrolase [Armatimonadota bacterium]
MSAAAPSAVVTCSPRVRRVRAPNPSPMTGTGTNTYLVGHDAITVIDPGPDDTRHVAAVLAATGGRPVRWILVTHRHSDHAPAAAALAQATGAAVLALAGSSVPHDRALCDGEVVEGPDYTLDVLHTPGHASDHLCALLREERALFAGDLVAQGSTVVIAPPDGDMAAYLRSLARVRTLDLARLYPGHGEPVDAPRALLDEYIAHRLMREQQILNALQDGPRRIEELVAAIYTDVPAALHPVAARSVLAHLLKLRAEGRVAGEEGAPWTLLA